MHSVSAAAPELKLASGFTFADLYDRDGLVRLDGAFLDRLQATDTALANRLLAARAAPAAMAAKDESNLLIDLGPHVEAFVGSLFGIEDDLRKLFFTRSGPAAARPR